jgi:phosphoribosylformylglycinamidine synthase
MAVFRIYVEKKREYAVEAQRLTADIRHFLQISALEDLRMVNRYDVEGIDRELFEQCRYTVFSEPQVDNSYTELPEAPHTIAVEYLPGQYDQRADSCAQCIQFVSQQQRPMVRTARIYLLYGPLSPQDIQIIKDYLINPIECREASLEPFTTLKEHYEIPGDVPILTGFRDMEDKDLADFLSRYGLAMDQADLAFCRDYFRSEGRDPSLTEIRMIDTYWSDHCRHTTFLTRIKSVTIEDSRVGKAFQSYLNMRLQLGLQDNPITLMDIATIGAKYLKHTGALTNLEESGEVNACSVKADVDVDGEIQPWLLMFKNETHNHPTEIEPFGGAATCIGGAIRDPLSGRSYVYQAMRITGAANPLTPVEQTLPGKLPQRKIVTEAAAGYSSYGNQVGVATGLVKEIYHPGYVAKRLEMGAVIGAAPADQVVRETPAPGDGVILVGGKTGRDGCGGATGSSKSHSVSSLEACGSEVQKGNAPEERKIQRLFRNEKVSRLIKRCNDFGAGGVSVAIGELADSLDINLDAVPKKYEGLDGTELAISESQERMAVVVAPESIDLFIEYAKEENLEATLVARVTDTGRLTMHWRGKKIVDISRKFLNSNGAPKHAKVEVPERNIDSADLGFTYFEDYATAQSAGYKDFKDYTTAQQQPCLTFNQLRPALEKMVADLNFCSQKGLVDRFDSTIGAGTVLMPFGGVHQATPAQAMVAKLPVLKGDTTTCSAMSWGFNPFIAESDPYAGSYLAVVESVAKLIAIGGNLENCWLSFQEYFEKLGDDPKRWGKPFAALLGALSAQRDLNVASIGGKDSMSGSFEDLDVPPTLISVAVSLCNAETVISPEFKEAGNPVLLIAPEYTEDGLPERESLLNCFNTVQQLIKEKKVLSTYAITSSSCTGALFEMSLGNRIGLRFAPDFDLAQLFKCAYGGFVVEWNSTTGATGSASGSSVGTLPGIQIGTTIEEFRFEKDSETIELERLETLYRSTLEPIYPTAVQHKTDGISIENSLGNTAGNMPKDDMKNTLENAVENLSMDAVGKTPRDSIGNIPEDDKRNTPGNTVGKTPGIVAGNSAGKPKALIPVFPGTNCEYDTAKAFERAGGIAEIAIIRNLTPEDVTNSIKEIAEKIRNSQIIILPGGFSGGDEPDGSGKFITSFFRNPVITEEVQRLLDQRDGLILGICNGFQALVKLGLVPFGHIRQATADSPTLTFNPLGRHHSGLIRTRIVSNKSPWLMDMEIGEIHTIPVSHGEGRFIANDELLKQLAANGQIAAQYVDLSGAPTMDVRFNLNSSSLAIEAVTSPDGRILGKMGHSERTGKWLYKNVPGNKEQRLFENAVKYYGL